MAELGGVFGSKVQALSVHYPATRWVGGDLPQQVVFNVSFLIRYICQTLSVNYNMIPFHEEPLMCSSEL